MRIDFEELSIPGLDTMLTGTAHVDFDQTFAEPMVTSVSLTDPCVGRIDEAGGLWGAIYQRICRAVMLSYDAEIRAEFGHMEPQYDRMQQREFI